MKAPGQTVLSLCRLDEVRHLVLYLCVLLRRVRRTRLLLVPCGGADGEEPGGTEE